MIGSVTSFDPASLVLGTALWGWKIKKKDAFLLLDKYAEQGGRLVDTAENYPINKQPGDMGLAAKWIGEWLAVNPASDISIWYKMGALNNLGDSCVDLSSRHLESRLDDLQSQLHGKIKIVGVHWDNRSSEDLDGILDTIAFFKKVSEENYSVALSGIKNPTLYFDAWPEKASDWLIQVKDNALTSDARLHYSQSFPRAKFYAYGINMGGVKSTAPPPPDSSLALRGLSFLDIAKRIETFLAESFDVAPSPRDFNEFALMRAFLIPQMRGIILGSSNIEQLQQSLSFWKKLQAGVSDNALTLFSEFM